MTDHTKALADALERLMRNFPTDTDMLEAGWTGSEVECACQAHDAAHAVLAAYRSAQQAEPTYFVMHPDDPALKLLPDGSRVVLQRNLPALVAAESTRPPDASISGAQIDTHSCHDACARPGCVEARAQQAAALDELTASGEEIDNAPSLTVGAEPVADACTYHCEAWPECRCAPKEPEPFELDPLEQIIDAYLDEYILDDGDEVSHKPGEFEQFLIKDAIMGLLADKDWDEHWGRLIAEQAAKLTAPAAQAEPVAWQPIETAPRDGSDVLLHEIYERLPVVGWWCEAKKRWFASTEVYDADGDACVIDKLCTEGVTHWMPLPTAPGSNPPAQKTEAQ